MVLAAPGLVAGTRTRGGVFDLSPVWAGFWAMGWASLEYDSIKVHIFTSYAVIFLFYFLVTYRGRGSSHLFHYHSLNVSS